MVVQTHYSGCRSVGGSLGVSLRMRRGRRIYVNTGGYGSSPNINSTADGHVTGADGHVTGSHGHVTGSHGHVTGADGHVTGSHRHVTGAHCHAASSHGRSFAGGSIVTI